MILQIFNAPGARTGELCLSFTGRLARIFLAVSMASFPTLASAQIQEGEAFISCFPGVANGKIDVTSDSGGIIDIRSPGIVPTANNWPAIIRGKVTPLEVGLIFGIAIDHEQTPNVYVANSAAFGLHIENAAGITINNGAADARWMDGQFGSASISPGNPEGEPALYKINSQTNAVSRFGTLTNDGPGFGNIAFNPFTAQPNFYVSDLSNGMIYHLDQNGIVTSSIDHGTAQTSTSDNGVTTDISTNGFTSAINDVQSSWGVTQASRLVWGLGVHKRQSDATARLFYGVGQGTSAKIFSVSLGATGSIGADIVDENIDLSGIIASNYITDIAFSSRDEIIIAERGLRGSLIQYPYFYNAHSTRVMRFTWDNTSQTWTLSPAPYYDVGIYSSGQIPNGNSAGGVDFSYGLDNNFNLDRNQCDDRFIAMGDYLQNQSGNFIYGLQNSPVSNVGNVLPQSYFTDIDGNLSGGEKTQNGDVEVFRKACAVPAAPPTGATLKVCKVAGDGVEIGTPFEFGYSWSTDQNGGREEGGATVLAGPAPGGYCQVIATDVPTDRGIAIGELRKTGYVVTDIAVAGAGTPSTIDPENRFVTLDSVGEGVTEVTFTNEYRTGFLEICKFTDGPSDALFEFTVEETGERYELPGNTCTAAIEVPAGNITILETPEPGWAMTGCSAYDPVENVFAPDRLVSCNVDTGRTVFHVPSGDISEQTLAFIGNATTNNEPAAARRSSKRSKRSKKSTRDRSRRDQERRIRNLIEGGE